MLEWIYFGLICYSIGVVTGFMGVIALFTYAMRRMKKQFRPPGAAS